jgi:hypothetical protein
VIHYLRGGRGADLKDQGGQSTAGGSDGRPCVRDRKKRIEKEKDVPVKVSNQSRQTEWRD